MVWAEGDGDGLPRKALLFFSVETPPRPMFYSLRLLSANGAGGIDSFDELVGKALKNRGMTGSHTGEKEGIAQSADR